VWLRSVIRPRPERRFEVRELAPDELYERFPDQALWIFSGALGFPRDSSRVRSFADTIRRHTGYGGFRAFGALNVRGRLVGFSYGYSSQPGLWWREQISEPLTPDERDFWLRDAFEFAELHVHPTAQGRGLGSRLHDALIAAHPHATALLSVMHRSAVARHLYASRGWETLVEDMRFSTEPQTAFSILGWRRPAQSKTP